MKYLLRSALTSAALAGALTMSSAAFAADSYKLDPSHSQVVFSYNHLGFSTTYGMFSGFTGEATLDMDNMANSTVKVDIPLSTMLTGWEKRDGHFKSADFFNTEKFPAVTFESTKVESTGDKTAKITGNLTVLGQTKEVVLDASLNNVGEHPQSKKGWAGFDATTTLKRTDFGLGKYAPYVSDEVKIIISAEMEKTN